MIKSLTIPSTRCKLEVIKNPNAPKGEYLADISGDYIQLTYKPTRIERFCDPSFIWQLFVIDLDESPEGHLKRKGVAMGNFAIDCIVEDLVIFRACGQASYLPI